MKKRIGKSIIAVVICLGLACNGPVLSVMAGEAGGLKPSGIEESVIPETGDVEEAEISEFCGADETELPGISSVEDGAVPDADTEADDTQEEAEIAEESLPAAEPAESDPAGDELLSSFDVDDAEEPAVEDVDPEEKLGDVEYKYYKPYESATYELKYHVLDDETISIDGYRGDASGQLILPDEIEGKAVTVIENSAFENCSGFTGSLKIPDSVIRIGSRAFDHCHGLTGSLKIPDNVKMIGEGAFYCCDLFDGSLTIGDGVERIAGDTFLGCNRFSSLTIGKSVKSIDNSAFSGCFGFRKVVNRSGQAYWFPSVSGKTWINAKTGGPIAHIANGTAIRSDFYDPLDTLYFTHKAVNDQTYSGKAIKPAVEVYFGTRHLEEKKDYTITYANNINAGMASFTVTGKGNYAGKDSDSFVILKKKLTDADVIVTEPAAAKHTKKEQKPVPKITYNGMTLKKGKDFELAYFSDEFCREWCIPQEPGTYYIRITGIGNFEGQLKKPFVIANPTKKLMSSLKADKIKAQDYTTGGVTLSDEDLVIRDGGKTLKKGEDYVVDDDIDYTDNKSPGTAKVTLHGVEEKGYVGTLTLSFQIKGTPINKVAITAPEDVEYNGSAQTPAPEVKLNDTDLIKDQDYVLAYEKNTNAGKAKVIIKGIGGYTGSVSKTFTIRPAEIEAWMVQTGTSYPYTGSGVKPAVRVTGFTGFLEEKKDYTVKYSNNTAVAGAAAEKKPTVTVTGKGNYTGKVDLTFVITGANINTCKVAVDDVIYKDQNGNWKPKKVTVLGTDGKSLKAGKDYDDKNIRFTSDEEGEYPIEPDAKLDADTPVYVWVDAKGTNYAGTVMGTYRIMAQDIGKLTASIEPKAYTKSAVKLDKYDITWKLGGKAVNDVTFDFDDSTYTNNVNKGKATVVVKGTGNYGGTKTITFTIGSKGILWWWRNLFN